MNLGVGVLKYAAAAFALAAPAALCAQDLSSIVEKMSEAQHAVREQHTAYELLRRYQVFDGDDRKLKTELVAKIDFAPPGQKSYIIQESSGGMGERVIRHALDHEVDLTKDPDRIEMTERNYTFTLDGEGTLDGHRCYILESHPKRNDHDLLQAKVWVDSQDFRIRRVQGRPQKSPSFWVKRLDVTLDYSEVAGMWMHTSTRADADVRWSGPFTMVSDDVSVRLSSGQLASAMPKRRHARGAMLGAALRTTQ